MAGLFPHSIWVFAFLRSVSSFAKVAGRRAHASHHNRFPRPRPSRHRCTQGYSRNRTTAPTALQLPLVKRVVPRTVKEHDGLRAVLLTVALPFLGDGIKRLIPTDALEIVRATLADALHGIQDAVGAVDTAHLGQTTRANTVVFRVRHIARGRTHHLTVAHVHIQKAAATAVATAYAGEDLRLRGLGLRGVGFLEVCRLRAAAGKGACRREGRRSLDEAPASETMLRGFSHAHLLSSRRPKRPHRARRRISHEEGRCAFATAGGKAFSPPAFRWLHSTRMPRLLR